jgi:hypothetical protein
VAEFITKDSGERAQFESGMQRDTEAGKPRFDLMLPPGVPYEEQMITRFAALLGRGAEKYAERNWEQADSAAEMERMKSSAFRHLMQLLCGERDEDHAAAVIFNVVALETTRYKVESSPVGCEHDHLHSLDCEGVTIDQIRSTLDKISEPDGSDGEEIVEPSRFSLCSCPACTDAASRA